MAKVKKEKKENKIVAGIIMLIAGIVAIAMSGEYVWMLFHVIEVPLWLVGGLAVIAGIISLIQGIKENKAKKAQQQQAE